MKACYMCNNALIDDELTENNDYSAVSVGRMPERKRLMLCSGYGCPVRIEFEEYDDVYCRWRTVGVYYPKFCPNCGREIVEGRSK